MGRRKPKREQDSGEESSFMKSGFNFDLEDLEDFTLRARAAGATHFKWGVTIEHKTMETLCLSSFIVETEAERKTRMEHQAQIVSQLRKDLRRKQYEALKDEFEF